MEAEDNKTVSEEQAWAAEKGDVDIRPEDWRSFLDTFSRQHLNWRVTIEIAGENGVRVEATELRLKAVNLDTTHGRSRAYIEVGEPAEHYLTHMIEYPTRVRFKRTATGEHAGLEISSADGTTTWVRFRVAMKPEMLDGLLA
jgi:hypothetical protein